MYYNRILRVWVFDPLDYFLISALIGSLLASHLKTYLSEKAAMERLKKSIINKSGLLAPKPPILESKDSKIKRIYKFAVEKRGGQLEDFKADHEFSNKVWKMAQQIEQMVTRLAAFRKRRELKGLLKIFFSHGRLILELILYKCRINISYAFLTEEVSTQVIVFTATAGGAAGFTLSWFTAGAVLVAPPILITTFLLRSFTQQMLNQMEYSKFKKMVNQMLDDDDLKETLRAVFLEGEGPATSSSRIEMGPSDLDQNPALKHACERLGICEDTPHFSGELNVGSESVDILDGAGRVGKSSEELEEFIKENFGLIENPTETQLEEIIKEKVKRKPKGETVYFRDLIDEIPDYDAGISDSDIIDAEIIEEPIRVKSGNEL